uniref:Integrase core domain-containing protein n=1 Tax=Candidatus Kentrum eta TaxID=2126337 RepID=A0A450VCB2_9GAMM|nr:MAG: hypothetical protein BECKH772B_GA0070898_102781 [Candidatus Kentron sp. H]VFK02536.1 MAG: hypothetical protein BECKH772A_GA0070896_102754 [Candidatus Kentron sp. H]VFK05472.1 MAG: hypothetical protein BECKH772C_GA0070978_102764 [Candidatus Kentron sp. H]
MNIGKRLLSVERGASLSVSRQCELAGIPTASYYVQSKQIVDITYIRLEQGFRYLVAVIDWYSRKVPSLRISNTLDARFRIDCLYEAAWEAGALQHGPGGAIYQRRPHGSTQRP